MLGFRQIHPTLLSHFWQLYFVVKLRVIKLIKIQNPKVNKFMVGLAY